jgi:hypothetical protein
MTRPALTHQISGTQFRSYYWAKEELLSFCRAQHLPTGGSKQDMTDRIAAFLFSGKASTTPFHATQKTSAPGAMPATFSRTTLIAPGWRCSQALRTFFKHEIGSAFHFNAVMRNFIHHGSGKTLQEAMNAWHAARSQPSAPSEIAPQFEYNRHMRVYFQTHPKAGLAEAVRAWKVKKQTKTKGE